MQCTVCGSRVKPILVPRLSSGPKEETETGLYLMTSERHIDGWPRTQPRYDKKEQTQIDKVYFKDQMNCFVKVLH